MGVDQTFYYGPYFECKFEGKPATRLVYYCSADSSHRVSGTNFCPGCGARIDTRNEPTGRITSEIDRETLEDELDQHIYKVDYSAEKTDYWVSNRTNIGLDRKTSLGKYEEDALEVTSDLIQKELRIFQEFHAREFAILKNHYRQVRIVWGILSYCY